MTNNNKYLLFVIFCQCIKLLPPENVFLCLVSKNEMMLGGSLITSRRGTAQQIMKYTQHWSKTCQCISIIINSMIIVISIPDPAARSTD